MIWIRGIDSGRVVRCLAGPIEASKFIAFYDLTIPPKAAA